MSACLPADPPFRTSIRTAYLATTITASVGDIMTCYVAIVKLAPRAEFPTQARVQRSLSNVLYWDGEFIWLRAISCSDRPLLYVAVMGLLFVNAALYNTQRLTPRHPPGRWLRTCWSISSWLSFTIRSTIIRPQFFSSGHGRFSTPCKYLHVLCTVIPLAESLKRTLNLQGRVNQYHAPPSRATGGQQTFDCRHPGRLAAFLGHAIFHLVHGLQRPGGVLRR